MNRSDLQKLTNVRIREARSLLNRGFPAGSYYLCGYAVECALKACIAKQTRRFDFPDRRKTNKAYVHDLKQLFELSGFYGDFQKAWMAEPTLELNWGIASNWSEESRYILTNTPADAKVLYSACTSRKYGVLSWIKKRW